METKLDGVEKQLGTLTNAVDALTAEMRRREGAQKIAQVIVGLVSGGSGAALVKLFPWLSTLPK